jgi:hypothetical protein
MRRQMKRKEEKMTRKEEKMRIKGGLQCVLGFSRWGIHKYPSTPRKQPRMEWEGSQTVAHCRKVISQVTF